MASIQENSFSSGAKSGSSTAAGLAALSVVSVVLPIINIKIVGFGGGLALASPHFLGDIAYLLPLAFLAGLVARFAPPAQPFVRLLEIVGLAITVGVGLYAIVTLLNGINELRNADQQMSQMLGSASARQFSSMRGLSLGSGSFALVFLLLGSTWQVWSGRRR